MNSETDSGENAVAMGPAVLLAVCIGLGVIIFTFLLKWIKQEQQDTGNAKNDKPDKVKGSSTDASGKHGKKEQAGGVKPSSKKKLTERENRRTARANEKGFNHPWLLATLKGHTGRVLDMDFSANGKYLVSCGDEDPDPGGMSHYIRSKTSPTSDNSSESNKENSLPPSSTPSPVMVKGLSRRQRKNRKRENSAPATKTEKERETCKSEQVKTNKKNKNSLPGKSEEYARDPEVQEMNHFHNRHRDVKGRVRGFVGVNLQPLEEYKRLNLPDSTIVQILKEKYSLTKELMGMLEYPLRPELQGLYRKIYEYQGTHGVVYYYHHYYQANKRHHHLDVHAEEFVPKNDSGDSGNGSSSSSEEESSSGSEGESINSTSKPALKLTSGTIKWKDARTHLCARCGTFFYTTSKQYITRDGCRYHSGKIQTLYGVYGPMTHSCCGQLNGSPGCKTANLHVWSGPHVSSCIVNSCFVETEPPTVKRADNNYGVYSLDCEMSYTVKGLEVVKVTLVDIRGMPVYNEYVKPVNKVVDFNTMFSGIVAEDFIRNPTKSLVQVQRDLKTFICSETVLIGHGLENDLKALKMIHKTVVDTAFTFPHFKGLPYKRSLKSLAQACLNKQIQCGTQGHDSFEDARTCMELMLLRLQKDYSYYSSKVLVHH